MDPVAEADVYLAYGRDLEGNWTYLEPTPDAVNIATTYAGWLRPVTFSQERGFFETPFTLTLVNTNAEATVYYSFDGSVPGVPYTTGLSDRKSTRLNSSH